MKKILLAVALLLMFASGGASAQERVGSAALGALSGAVVLGPIGAVAGAAVGYAAGPSIARSWGLHGSRPPKPRQVRRGERSGAVASTAPPTRAAMQANGQMQTASTPPPQAAPSVPQQTPQQPAPPRETSMPPVQGFE
jgi:hypothetical protein